MLEVTSEPRTAAVDVQGARLYYEVRGSGPLLILVGCPMDAESFAPLAIELAGEYTVVTVDPRGFNRSWVADRRLDVTPEVLAADLASLIAHLKAGPASIFGSSGGAVAALALAQDHPQHAGLIVAHEPPLEELLPDRRALRAQTEAAVALHSAGDTVGAWMAFFFQAGIEASVESVARWQSGLDPQAAADQDFFFAHSLRPSTWWLPNLAVLTGRSERIVVGVGDGSAGQSCARTSAALATALRTTPVTFPGGHTGFVEDPAAFAGRLRSVLLDRFPSPYPGGST